MSWLAAFACVWRELNRDASRRCAPTIIEHGVRLSGIPAWGNGTPQGERESWAPVHFVRRLPKLTSDDVERMESLNPKTPAQFKEEEETRRFLQGEPDRPGAPKKDRQD